MVPIDDHAVVVGGDHGVTNMRQEAGLKADVQLGLAGRRDVASDAEQSPSAGLLNHRGRHHFQIDVVPRRRKDTKDLGISLRLAQAGENNRFGPLAICGMNQIDKFPGENLLEGPSGDGHRGRIDIGQHAVLGDEKDRVVGALDKPPVTFLGAPQRLFHPLADGDVTQDHLHGPSSLIVKGNSHCFNLDDAAVEPDVSLLHERNRQVLLQDAVDALGDAVSILRIEEVKRRATDHLLATRGADKSHGSIVHVDDDAVGVDKDRIGGQLDHPPVVLFAGL